MRHCFPAALLLAPLTAACGAPDDEPTTSLSAVVDGRAGNDVTLRVYAGDAAERVEVDGAALSRDTECSPGGFLGPGSCGPVWRGTVRVADERAHVAALGEDDHVLAAMDADLLTDPHTFDVALDALVVPTRIPFTTHGEPASGYAASLNGTSIVLEDDALVAGADVPIGEGELVLSMEVTRDVDACEALSCDVRIARDTHAAARVTGRAPSP